jgi:hypothetical protein
MQVPPSLLILSRQGREGEEGAANKRSTFDLNSNLFSIWYLFGDLEIGFWDLA